MSDLVHERAYGRTPSQVAVMITVITWYRGGTRMVDQSIPERPLVTSLSLSSQQKTHNHSDQEDCHQ